MNKKPAASETTSEPKKEAAKKEEEPVKEEKKKFVRVAIEEDSDEEEEEPKIEDVSENKQTKTVRTLKSKFPMKNQKEIDIHNREAKQQMQAGGAAFMKKF